MRMKIYTVILVNEELAKGFLDCAKGEESDRRSYTREGKGIDLTANSKMCFTKEDRDKAVQCLKSIKRPGDVICIAENTAYITDLIQSMVG